MIALRLPGLAATRAQGFAAVHTALSWIALGVIAMHVAAALSHRIVRQDTQRNLNDVESLVARLEVLPFDDLAAYRFGQIRAELYDRVRPSGPYDMMIAGHARSRGLMLVSNNLAEFERVQGLRIENWAR